jgi:hypothetical protein
MRQLTFIKPGTLEWRELPEPKIEAPTDALVRPIDTTGTHPLVGTCECPR